VKPSRWYMNRDSPRRKLGGDCRFRRAPSHTGWRTRNREQDDLVRAIRRWLSRQRHLYPVKLMARVLGVSRSGFYAWLTRSPSARSENDEKMKPLIRIAHKAGRETYGPRRIQTELQSSGTFIGRDRIARLRREMRITCIQKRKFKATTNSAHSLPVVENLLDRAVQYRKPEPGCIHHSDRGSQYCATSCRRAVVALGMRPSMSRKGNCYDNAPAVFAENHLSERRSA
jgi:hypothetical protein